MTGFRGGAFYNPWMFPEVAQDSPLLHNLNPEQRSAVTLPPEHALILAGAGSGKTRVLTTRIAWLLQTGQVSPGGILAVTFTNKAAKEMMTRLTAMLPLNVRGMWIGTFHGLCNRFLRAHYKLANLPQAFQILDTQDQLSAIKRLMKQFNIDDDASRPSRSSTSYRATRKKACAPMGSRRATRKRARRSRSTSSTKTSANAKAWWISGS
jgi:DNA helicase-2/ATP-dependent DNA helicase PcrA